MTRRTWIPIVALIASIAIATRARADAPSAPGIGKSVKDAKDAKNAKNAPAKPDEAKGDEKPFDTVVKDADRIEGLFTFWRRADDNKVWLEIKPEQLDQSYLFTTSIARSAGERGFYGTMMGRTFPFHFHKVGKSVQLVVENTDFIADAGTPQARAVAQSFTDAVLAAVKLQAKPHPDRKSLLVDAAELFASRDYPGMAAGLSEAYAPTNFSFDKDKTSIGAVRAFPQNVLLDVAMNFATENFNATSVTLADPRSVPITVQYQLSPMPGTGYRPRLADDRVGHFVTIHQDFTSDHPQTPYVRYIERWRLEKQDPAAAVSPPKQPIVYWLDNNIPLEYRDAVRDGALMWNKAFEKAGFKDAVVVKQMPDSANWDPADIRYNTIRWFAGVDATFAIGPHRSDPRTGEILDADISLSEGLFRQARRFAQEVATPVGGAASVDGQPVNDAGFAKPAFAWAADTHSACTYGAGLADQVSLGMAMLDARGELTPELEQTLMKQYVTEIVAHEVGHTLGLRHNFHASTLLPADELTDAAKTSELGQAGSVMDYNPMIVAAKGQRQGEFLSTTLGLYDYWAIEYAYKPIEPADEPAELARIASRCADPQLQYATDEDALGTFSPLAADPLVNQYDQSNDPLAYFRQRIALVNELFAGMEQSLAKPGAGYQVMRRATGRAFGDLNRSLLTSSKFVGGVYMHRDHVGDPDGRMPFEPVPAAKQREALDLLAKNCFGERSFNAPASLLNKLAIERIPSLDPAYFSVVRLDYPWHAQVLAVQKGVLDRMYHPVTLGRVLDNELRFGKGESAFHMADLFAGLDNAIWSELDRPVTTIPSLRRNLQREQLRDLIRMTLRDGTTVVDAGLGPVPVPLPEDATTLARASLVRLQAKMRAKLAGKAALEPTTKAHLQECAARISTALAAQMSRSVN